MKKVFSLSLVLGFSLLLSGCIFNPWGRNNEAADEMVVVDDNDSLEVIEEDLNDTELEEFEAELDAMDEEINQL
jgi:PBP1b-binding outer membrane lipoprotein LpoB